jgi:hypothetical protein
MNDLLLVVVFLAFLVVVVVIVRDDTELTRIATKGLVETMRKALTLFRG